MTFRYTLYFNFKFCKTQKKKQIITMLSKCYLENIQEKKKHILIVMHKTKLMNFGKHFEQNTLEY